MDFKEEAAQERGTETGTRGQEVSGFFGALYRRFQLLLLLGIGLLFLCIWMLWMLSGRIGAVLTCLLGGGLALLCALFLLRFGRSFCMRLSEVRAGIHALSLGEAVTLPEEGATAELARGINRTSEMLFEQQKLISGRDTARAEWIRGISHDIRTPLSMVMGYSELLEEDALNAEQRHAVSIIKEQSVKMKKLIDDLNLISKLEYNCQPLRMSRFYPAGLLREAVADAVNAWNAAADGRFPEDAERYRIELLIFPEFEAMTVEADEGLLRRVFDNLIGNAARHNPEGCSITLLAYCSRNGGIVEVQDDGCGIPEPVARTVNGIGSLFALPETEEEPEARLPDRPHIMGLRIAKQIMLAHGGNLIVKPDRHTIEVIF